MLLRASPPLAPGRANRPAPLQLLGVRMPEVSRGVAVMEQLLRDMVAFVLVVRVNTVSGPDPDADWDYIYEWADKLLAQWDSLVREDAR